MTTGALTTLTISIAAKYFRRYFVFRYKTHIILILSFKSYLVFEHLTSFMEQLLMYFGRHKRMETNVVKDNSPPNHFGPETFRDQGLFSVLSHSKTGQGITMAETLIIILAEHNVPINIADHFTKLVSNKLIFPYSVYLRVRAVRAPC